MDHDDPEQRISDLENRLSVPGEPGRLSAAQVHDVAFSKPAARRSAGPLPSARHGGRRHGTEETWPRRVLNAVTDFVAWVLD